MSNSPSQTVSSKALLDSYKRVKEKDFTLTIQSSKSSEPIELKGFFSFYGNSLYAHCDDPKASGGSNDSDQELARIKAIMRMLNGIESRLNGLSRKELNDLDLGIGRRELQIALRLKKFCNFNPSPGTDRAIPVYEEIAERYDGKFRYSKQFTKYVTDFNQVIEDERKRFDRKSTSNGLIIDVSIEKLFPFDAILTTSPA